MLILPNLIDIVYCSSRNSLVPDDMLHILSEQELFPLLTIAILSCNFIKFKHSYSSLHSCQFMMLQKQPISVTCIFIRISLLEILHNCFVQFRYSYIQTIEIIGRVFKINIRLNHCILHWDSQVNLRVEFVRAGFLQSEMENRSRANQYYNAH